MGRESVLNVLYQSDDNYAVYMGVSICSLLENNQSAEEINLYIINDHISKENITKLSQMIKKYNRQVYFLDVETICELSSAGKIPSYNGMRKNSNSYFKLFLDSVLPENMKRIVYIDCDTLVVGELQDLMNMDMEGHVIGMSLDSVVLKSKESIGLKKTDYYYNSGVILFDLEKWRTDRCSERIVEHLNHKRTYGTVDQDVLNIEFKDDILTLPMMYNVQPVHMRYNNKIYFKCYPHPENSYYDTGEIDFALKNKKIIHFFRYIGESPWHKNNVHPARKLFDQYIAMTPWNNYVKKKANRGAIFKIEKVLYKILPKRFFLMLFTYVHDKMVIKSNS